MHLLTVPKSKVIKSKAFLSNRNRNYTLWKNVNTSIFSTVNTERNR